MFQEIENNSKALLAYIESAYHLSDEKLLEQRESLLRQEGTITRRPYIESSARYKKEKRFAELNVPQAVRTGFTTLAKSKLLFEPYLHQEKTIEAVLTERRNVIVTTGTGSGKTECFLLPILGRLIEESALPSFGQRAVRALLLYPMNALVNDQLGRLRWLFGHPACRKLFNDAAGRPAKFGRYTGRTLFPGYVDPADKRYTAKMYEKLAGLRFFADLAEKALTNEEENVRKEALTVIEKLHEKGKFPAKNSGSGDAKDVAEGFLSWFGGYRDRWLADGVPVRAVARKSDAELLLRSEMQKLPPDILVTNYSMLEYMLLRPIERNIFAETKKFFAGNKDQRFLLVLDESHLYTGAQGTEVAMLVRRLKHRFDLQSDQFQVICTSASFGDAEKAREFAAELAGVPLDSITAITSDESKDTRAPSGPGTLDDAQWLSGIDLDGVRKNPDELSKISEELQKRPVWGRLANLTSLAKHPNDPMTVKNDAAPQDIQTLAGKLFEDAESDLAHIATDRLIELASMAKSSHGDPLFAARVHCFYRGLPGLWACSDPHCTALRDDQRNELTGKLYVQTRRYCECGHRCFELHSCKKCGTSYFHAWTDNVSAPQYLWMENVGKIDGAEGTVQALHILLQDPQSPTQEKTTKRTTKKATRNDPEKYLERSMNVITGALSDFATEKKTRTVWIPNANHRKEAKGLFTQCPICGAAERNISGHKTRGDQPFQHLIASQLLEQSEQPKSVTPLKGRKVLIFSDGRQAASRLAGHLTENSLRDAIRPLMVAGYCYLQERFNDPETQSLQYAYAAVLAGAYHHGITLAPTRIRDDQNFDDHYRRIRSNLERTGRNSITWGTFRTNIAAFQPLESVLTAIYATLLNEDSGYHTLGLARIVPDTEGIDEEAWQRLPVPPGVPASESAQWKKNLLDLWVQLMMDKNAVLLPHTPGTWHDNKDKYYPKRADGKFVEVFKHIIRNDQFVKSHFSDARNCPATWLKYFSKGEWQTAGTVNGFYLDGNKLRFEVTADQRSVRCEVCTRIFPLNPLIEKNCPFCRSSESVAEIDVVKMLSSSKRIQVYRNATDLMHQVGKKPYPFIAREHTAAISVVQPSSDDAFTLSEQYEIRFQDIELPGNGETRIPVDVLSCTTTMEVGIDIGSLTAVAMRNMPPNRSNYQQRAGRAGRRGSSLATINTYADQDSHSQRYFANPAAMIGGPVINPILNIDNKEIVLRHAFALIFSMFQQERIPMTASPNVFSSLGTVEEFQVGNDAAFSYRGLQKWLAVNRGTLLDTLKTVLPKIDAFDDQWIESIPQKLLDALTSRQLGLSKGTSQTSNRGQEPQEDTEPSENEDLPLDTEKLLGRLFAESLLPSYAFPTDVVAMHVFDNERSQQKGSPVLRYSPQYGLTQALSSYAPGKEVYIDGKRHYSFALWSPYPERHAEGWEKRKLYYECHLCGHTELKALDEGKEGDTLDCEGCRNHSLGPARLWMIPPGFAQPQDISPELPDDLPDDSFATQAKLTAETVGTQGESYSHHFIFWRGKEQLTLTNRGVNDGRVSGFNYCDFCERIEPFGWRSEKSLVGKPHDKPYPPRRYGAGNWENKQCGKKYTWQQVVLGTQFNSDVVLIRLKFPPDIHIMPGSHLSRIVLGTLATAMSQTAVQELEIEPNNIGGEFRPATTEAGRNGCEADIFLYDNVADGAGLVQAATKDPRNFLEKVLERLQCDCEHACPRCLQNYQNRYLHGDLDRQAAAGLLRLLLHGIAPKLDEAMESRLLRILAEDLKDNNVDVVMEQCAITIPASKIAVFVSHALKPDLPATERTVIQEKSLRSAGWRLVPVSHLTIDRALPAATQGIISQINSERG